MNLVRQVILLLITLLATAGPIMAAPPLPKSPETKPETKSPKLPDGTRLDAYVEVESKLLQISDKIVQLSFRVKALQRDILTAERSLPKR